LAEIRSLLERLAEEAGTSEPARFAHQWQMLMLGSIVSASTGDIHAGRVARDAATILLASAVSDA
jgi:hypothetical protein